MSRLHSKQDTEASVKKDNNRDWINDIFSYIDHHLQHNISLTTLANEALVSPAHFSRVFKDITGMGLTVYVNKKRIFKAKELLITTNYTISYVAEKCGFESIPHFYRTFKKYIGTTPAHFRKEKVTK
ncbi:helix-turn-helix transcriptional regulator [Gracilibacillus saliphilus]|uniref:helix-turn-helix transcriptional regulator n=1 Tax=Gracilibacillus saliphilus TaxID=543890 RepID=UPI0013D57087|nr:AraC family transcriptional regulator [Gracilibacillus saliphilus]